LRIRDLMKFQQDIELFFELYDEEG
jgi:hypothetical protein